jgi:xylulokinase
VKLLSNYLIGVDIGTSGCKLVIFDENYQILSLAHEEYSVNSIKSGWVELEPKDVWGALCNAMRAAIKQIDTNLTDRNFYLSFSVLGDGLLLANKKGELLYPGILSSDFRSIAFADQITNDFGNDYIMKITGRAIHPMTVLPKILWAQHNLPDLINEDTIYHDFQSWLFTKLGVGPVTDYSNASGTLLYSLEKRTWFDELLAYAGLKTSNLPECVAPGTMVGTLKDSLLQELGFPAGSKVRLIVGAMDQQCNALGSGTVEPEDCIYSMGTVHCLNFILQPSADINSLIKIGSYKFPTTIPGQFSAVTLLFNGGGSLKWFCQNFARKEKEEAEQINSNIYNFILHSEPRTKSIFYLPHLSGSGTPWMNPLSRGAFLGLTLAADVPSMANAIIEGVGFELKENLSKLEELNIFVRNFKVIGGGSKSDKWLQLISDILNQKVIRLANNEAGCLGAAILAGYGGQLYNDLKSISKKAINIDKIFEPSEKVELYQKKFEIYQKIYPIIKDLNYSIAEFNDN